MKKINVINSIVFLFATAVIISIFYEGLTLKWYAVVPVIMFITDICFIIATAINLIFNRNKKLFFSLNIFSALFIVTAIVMKIFNFAYPQWGIVFWNFYILYFYGTQTLIWIFEYIQSKTGGRNVF